MLDSRNAYRNEFEKRFNGNGQFLIRIMPSRHLPPVVVVVIRLHAHKSAIPVVGARQLAAVATADAAFSNFNQFNLHIDGSFRLSPYRRLSFRLLLLYLITFGGLLRRAALQQRIEVKRQLWFGQLWNPFPFGHIGRPLKCFNELFLDPCGNQIATKWSEMTFQSNCSSKPCITTSPRIHRV